MGSTSILVVCAEMLVDSENRNVDCEADEEELLLLLQPHQLHLHLTVRVVVVHYKLFTVVIKGQWLPRHCDGNG